MPKSTGIVKRFNAYPYRNASGGLQWNKDRATLIAEARKAVLMVPKGVELGGARKKATPTVEQRRLKKGKDNRNAQDIRQVAVGKHRADHVLLRAFKLLGSALKRNDIFFKALDLFESDSSIRASGVTKKELSIRLIVLANAGKFGPALKSAGKSVK